MIDSLQGFLEKAANSKIIEELNRRHQLKHLESIREGDFALVTMHRPNNVDNPKILKLLFSALKRISEQIPIIFPMHPRTRKLMSKLDEEVLQKLDQSHIIITEPIGYLYFLYLHTKTRLVLTDSGGVQVESSYLGIPCLTLRSNIEWQITLREGTNILVPLNEDEIVRYSENIMKQKKRRPAGIQFWDGKTAERIVNHLKKFFQLS